MAELLRDDGQPLACVTLELSETRQLLVERVISGKSDLLRYYFVEGRHDVLVDLGAVRLRGVLTTRWVGSERRWWVRLAASAQRSCETDAGTVDAGAEHATVAPGSE
ncbi:MAG: hypothetical protein HYX53_17080 [Chloroflexi bacterium]|nr:hypothetical protein [Chloroflexota bacterium]